MHAVVGDEMGSEEIVGVAEMNEGIIHDSGPGEDDPRDKREREKGNRETIGSVDQSDRLFKIDDRGRANPLYKSSAQHKMALY